MLLLDEPTNYLDLATQEELENMLQEYPGTILFISHDRAFIRSVADHILQVDESEPRVFHGNYEQYTKEQPRILSMLLNKNYYDYKQN